MEARPSIGRQSGRYKVNGNGECYWDASDSGPNQCWPATGRWKDDGSGGCYWEPNDGGPHQCVPDEPLQEPLPGMVPEPDWDDPYVGYDPSGIAQASGGPPASCRAHERPGNVGSISIQTDPVTGTVAIGAYMHWWGHNYGFWHYQVHVNGAFLRQKNQAYPPHDSVSPTDAPPGSLVYVYVLHVYPIFLVHWVYDFVDGQFRWVPIPSWQFTHASGSTSCIVPFPM